MSGTKPCLLFSGEIFDTSSDYKRIKNLLIGNFFIYVQYFATSFLSCHWLNTQKHMLIGLQTRSHGKQWRNR